MSDQRPVLVIGTTNRGKLDEFRFLLGDLPLTLTSLADYPGWTEVDEDGETFAANATKKARQWSTQIKAIVLADDSGLIVDALGGQPGVHSARYAGPAQDAKANIAKLLAGLGPIEDARRTARFECVVVVARPDGAALTASGECRGRIARAERGQGGFGYDPIFVEEGSGRTFAELSAEEKHRRSHRARAVAGLRPLLTEFLR